MRAVLANTEYFLHVSVSGLYTARRLKTVCLFVCLFVWSFRPTREIFNHMETAPVLVKGCKF